MSLLLIWPGDGVCWGFGYIFPLLRFGSWAVGSFRACAAKSGLWGQGELFSVLWRGGSRGQPLPSAAAFGCVSCAKGTAPQTGPQLMARQQRGCGAACGPRGPGWAHGPAGTAALDWARAALQSPLSPLGTEQHPEATMGQGAALQKKLWDPSDELESAMCLGISSTRKTFKTWIESCKGPPSQWGAGTQDNQREAEAAVFVSLQKRCFRENLVLSAVTCWEGGEKIYPHSSWGAQWKDERQLNTHCNMGNSDQMVGKNCSLWGWSNTEEGCPERFWSLQPWRYWNLNWTQPQATQASCPYFGQLVWLMASRSPFQTVLVCDAVILKLCCCFQASSVPCPALPPKHAQGSLWRVLTEP